MQGSRRAPLLQRTRLFLLFFLYFFFLNHPSEWVFPCAEMPRARRCQLLCSVNTQSPLFLPLFTPFVWRTSVCFWIYTALLDLTSKPESYLLFSLKYHTYWCWARFFGANLNSSLLSSRPTYCLSTAEDESITHLFTLKTIDK
jgi:hypothetical protein